MAAASPPGQTAPAGHGQQPGALPLRVGCMLYAPSRHLRVASVNIGSIARLQKQHQRRWEHAQWLGGCSGAWGAAQSRWLPVGKPEGRGRGFSRLAHPRCAERVEREVPRGVAWAAVVDGGPRIRCQALGSPAEPPRARGSARGRYCCPVPPRTTAPPHRGREPRLGEYWWQAKRNPGGLSWGVTSVECSVGRNC